MAHYDARRNCARGVLIADGVRPRRMFKASLLVVTLVSRISPVFFPAMKVTVSFTGTPSSQEINGTLAAVPCEAAFSVESTALLGLGSTCQFVSASTMMVRRC